MLNELTDKLRVLAYQKLEGVGSTTKHPVVRHARNLVSIVNELVGQPLCSAEELARRRERRKPVVVTTTETRAAVTPQAPVLVYFDGKDHRTKIKVEQLLRDREIQFQVLDVTDDEAERSWVSTAAKTSEFPIVVIAGTPVGGLAELTQLDLEGELKRRVFGPAQ
ncbi:MAG TPA: glutaredoxin domain-containing protein [Polyangia bacterium]|jgi:glutaredoxin|nr:glutaredoxin domain-containing protein [Polyangia bacterium]